MDTASMTQDSQSPAQLATKPPPEISAASPLTPAGSGPAELALDGKESLGEHHSEFAAFEEAYLGRYVALADTKATFVFGGAAAVIAYLFSQDAISAVAFAPVWSPMFVLLAVALAFLCLSALSAFSTIAPRLATSGEGIVFFGVVAAKASADAYLREIAGRSAADLTAARLKHCYDLSVVCDRKYRWLRCAMWTLLPGFVATACVLLLMDPKTTLTLQIG